jgi:putative tryptophan/tyrosine transport system substrate-binding protein
MGPSCRRFHYVEGKNVAIEYRWGEGHNDRLAGLANDLVHREVAVIAAFGPPAALAAKAVTATIPILFIAGTDPIDLGLVTNFRRPTGNVTGLNVFAEVLTPKRQELLHELVPTAPLVAMLVTSTAAQTQSELRDVHAAAGKLGQPVRIFDVSSDGEIDTAFAAIVDQRIGGLIVQADQFFTVRRDELVLLTTRHAIPTIFGWREFAVAGGLMSYGTTRRLSSARHLRRANSQGRKGCRSACPAGDRVRDGRQLESRQSDRRDNTDGHSAAR